jgi:hypothetical protein
VPRVDVHVLRQRADASPRRPAVSPERKPGSPGRRNPGGSRLRGQAALAPAAYAACAASQHGGHGGRQPQRSTTSRLCRPVLLGTSLRSESFDIFMSARISTTLENMWPTSSTSGTNSSPPSRFNQHKSSSSCPIRGCLDILSDICLK